MLRYDARAQGHSDIGTIEITAEVHITDFQNLLDRLNVQQTYLIGISHGAYIALRLAADCRGRHIIFPHTGHSLPVEAPTLFQQVVLDFLTRG